MDVVLPYVHERRQFDCDSCRYQFSVTSGTIFASRKMAYVDILAAISDSRWFGVIAGNALAAIYGAAVVRRDVGRRPPGGAADAAGRRAECCRDA